MEIFGFRLIVRLTDSNYGLTSFRGIRRGLLKRSQDTGCNNDPLSIVTSPWTRSAVGKRELGDFRVSPFYGRYDNSASLKNTLSGNLDFLKKIYDLRNWSAAFVYNVPARVVNLIRIL